MENFIMIAILIVLVGAAIFYIFKEKKKGKKCIGCPSSGCESCSCKKSFNCEATFKGFHVTSFDPIYHFSK